jgi:hypothetical protein
MIHVLNFVHINLIFYIAPLPKKKSSGIKSRHLVGHRIEPPLSVYLPGNGALRTSLVSLEKCGGAPSCWKIMLKVFEWRTVKVKHSA